ncbi:MAG: helix-turn-helix domain-containing protein [Ilumatobacter sp.]|uniref:helix-turn-helix domain-containing protein n=1 Tax=Ilumatobacter sp. TaxID=1967498 RepID=UPI00391D1CFF
MSEKDESRGRTDRPSPHWVRIEAAAEWLGCKVCYLRRLVAERRIPYSKVGKYLFFDLYELDAWIGSQRIDPIS